MNCMTLTLQQVLREEFREVKDPLHSLSSRVDTIELIQVSTDQKMATLGAKLIAQSQHLQQDDLENRNRRNNLKLPGIPEATTVIEFCFTVTAMINKILG